MITIENLVKTFGDYRALDGISLKIEPGELFFLLGPSGCGKTTLLRHIAGFYTPDQGRILFDGEDVTHVPPHKRNTGMMFQSYALWPHMTVAQNVAFGLEERRVPRLETRERVHAALASVQMEKLGDRKINQLSGGQQQRVALARALVIRPRCLLLDEPLSNLDAKLRLEMRMEIRRVCKEFGLTAVYVTHDQKEALSVSDRMAVMEGGRIAQIGTPEDVYRRPLTKNVADFIGETNFINATVVSITRDRARVEAALGQFEGVLADPSWQPIPGEKVFISIRPECWSLRSEGQPLNSVAGQIGETTYLGEVAQHRFASTLQHLKIIELNPRPSSRTPGTPFHACVEPDDVVIIKPTP
jgi:iron(III) transport system ATP-binding protein